MSFSQFYTNVNITIQQNIDLHALTGWIPERVAIRPKEPDFNATYVFERLQNGLAQGRCLITVATGELTDDESERTGLVATHAYAVLDLKEIDVSNACDIFVDH